MIRALLLANLMVTTLLPQAEACTAFSLIKKDRVLVAKSYDWYFGHGHGVVYTNPRGTIRKTLQLDDTPNPAQWVSKYGNVTLTQFGRGLPISGMNEKGLVIEMLQLDDSEYNSDQTKLPYVNEAQWSQYNLDNYASVKEVLENINKLRVVRAFTGIHYFLTDATGTVATVDFLKGKPVVHTGDNLPTPALSNDPYSHLVQYARDNAGEPPTNPFLRTSEVRFQFAGRGTALAESTPAENLDALAWDTLDAVRLNGTAKDAWLEPSQWNIVHDINARTIHFLTRGKPYMKTIRFSELDLSEGAQEKMLDMNVPVEGEVTRFFRSYNMEENTKLVLENLMLFTLAGQRSNIPKAIEFGRPIRP